MNIEDMQNVWEKMGQDLEHQKKLTNTLILKMTQERFTNKFSKLATYETLGALICFIAAFVIVLNFNKLDTWYLILCGILLTTYFVALPAFVLKSLYAIKAIKIDVASFASTLKKYVKAKNKLMLAQQLGIYLNFAALLLVIPVFSKLFKDKDVFVTTNAIWYWLLPILITLMIFVSKWGYNCYKKITNSAETLLKELEDVTD
ncbi:hypothetical protein AX016_2691 [Cellulophaga sp. RHA19]|uniref:hypothetical protein n=1 Tax=Cellulophaga sp. RHA19 TaxID=1798237 RepID=UPI000C2CAEB6|nr:hypothetical protein [Cellulophaga sp. RHA19]PKB44472.1 hypothetical protein AX016_2691 [Cellulophaga sp. RHA19]